MRAVPVLPVIEDPLSTDAEPPSHQAHANARDCRAGDRRAVAAG